jgi:mannose-6-phosphate isomerase
MSPLTFEPIFMERIWGGRELESRFGKKLPPGKCFGESWEIVDREEAQSVVREGPLRGKTLQELWTNDRHEIFGNVPDCPSRTGITRFPLLAKLIDAQEKLSLQVHPPAAVAEKLGSEPKTEIWYIVDAAPDAEIYAGLRRGVTRDTFEASVRNGSASELVHRIKVKSGDAMFMPSGRLHTMGAGVLVAEIQQNSDTTYRVFDWNRLGADGKPRRLHIDESLQSIDFNDFEPELVRPRAETLVRDPAFVIDKWNLTSQREAAPSGEFAIFCCLNGEVECAGSRFKPGEFFLVPAMLQDRHVSPRGETSLLRVTIPL